MDGRPHPPAYAAHTWQGFSTGKWEGDMLTVETTHLKPAYVRRDGLARSEKATVREHFIRNGNVLTLVTIVNDPVYLTEPYIKSRNFWLDPGYQMTLYPCSVDVEIDRPAGVIPHYLPGANPFLDEWAVQEPPAARSGARRAGNDVSGVHVQDADDAERAGQARTQARRAGRQGARTPGPAGQDDEPGFSSSRFFRSRWDAVAVVGAQQAGAGSAAEVHVLPIRGNLSMLVAPDGSNSAISIGDDGVFLVDTMSAASAQALLTAIRTLAGPKALRWIVNTSSHPDHAGGNAVLAPAGRLIASGNTRGGNAASIYAFQEAMMRLNGSAPGKDAVAPEGWPTDSFFVTQKNMFFNDEGVLLMHVPAASTDGDTIVMFRRSDVIAAGDTFTPQQYPIIDLDEGGCINGYIAGLNHLIDLTVTEPQRGRRHDGGSGPRASLR